MYTASNKSRAATRPQLGNAGLELILIVRVVLGNVGRDVKTHDESQIRLRPDDLLQELDGRALLKLEALPDRGTGIDHDSHPQGQVGLLGEIENLGGGFLIVQQGKISLLQILDEPAMLVGNGED